MPGFNPENINIHDLTIEEPEKESELLFDVERDITEQEWQKMKKELADRKRGSLHTFLEEAMKMKIIFPERADELTLDDEIWNMAKKLPKSTEDKGSFAAILMELKVLFPERMEEIELDNRKLESMGKELNRLKENIIFTQNYSASTFFAFATRMKVVFPEEFDKLKLLDPIEDITQSMKGYLKEKRQLKDWQTFLPAAVNFKILYPENVDELNLDTVFWKEIKSEMHKTHRRGWEISDFASALKILAAEEVGVTDKGLEVNMRKSDSAEPQSIELPEQRKF